MNKRSDDTMRTKASHDEVSWALHDLFRGLSKSLKEQGVEFLDYLCKEEYEELRNSFRKDQEKLCVLMGWTLELHDQMEHEQIMADMQAEQ
jgi:hypothetical protein